ncbi:MAG: exodeoxyribonuclease VII large subunit [Syntrophaceae bacterium]|nr:exodeoxyribonuclease VII large subunit [Syntrophaceae bacterium]
MELPFRYILTVSELTREIKDLLELRFPDIWIEGEVSNLRTPPSGHVYFTLKDDLSQIRAVLFKNQARTLRFLLEDGLHIISRGRVSLYEKRGEYQLILEEVEPRGIGALQLAFLQLKERLEREGLFDVAHKKPLPLIPQTIGIVTSPTGAVIRDMLHIIHRRFENVHILLYPVRVQGEGASAEISSAIEYLNKRTNVDVIIVGRGGGSLEDLWPFNEEVVARAIYNSKVPVISAVGHETDYTISDFVADLRAPTPSAAAELVVKDKHEVKRIVHNLKEKLRNRIFQIFQENRTHLLNLKMRLKDPRRKVEEYLLRADELFNRFRVVISWVLSREREGTSHLAERLHLQSPIQKVKNLRSVLADKKRRLSQAFRHSVEIRRQRLAGVTGKLDSLSPLSVLQRGYSITRKLPGFEILREAIHVKEGDKVEIRLYKGTLLCGVDKTKTP